MIRYDYGWPQWIMTTQCSLCKCVWTCKLTIAKHLIPYYCIKSSSCLVNIPRVRTQLIFMFVTFIINSHLLKYLTFLKTQYFYTSQFMWLHYSSRKGCTNVTEDFPVRRMLHLACTGKLENMEIKKSKTLSSGINHRTFCCLKARARGDGESERECTRVRKSLNRKKSTARRRGWS